MLKLEIQSTKLKLSKNLGLNLIIVLKKKRIDILPNIVNGELVMDFLENELPMKREFREFK
jgi:hypothetical protein